MPTVRIRGHDCFYERHGTEGERILFIMGFGMPGKGWYPQVEALQTDHQVAFYDNRGVGRSSKDRDPVGGLEGLADDAADLIEHLGWSKAHVVGVSMGGMVAQHLAIRHRPLLESLTLIATSPGPFHKSTPSRRGLSLFLEANRGSPERRLDALRSLLFPGQEAAHAAQEGVDSGIVEAVTTPSDPRTRLTQLGHILRHDTRQELVKLLALPTLVLEPGADLLVPPKANRALASLIPGARHVVFPDAGHGITWQYSADINQLLREHVVRATR